MSKPLTKGKCTRLLSANVKTLKLWGRNEVPARSGNRKQEEAAVERFLAEIHGLDAHLPLLKLKPVVFEFPLSSELLLDQPAKMPAEAVLLPITGFRGPN